MKTIILLAGLFIFSSNTYCEVYKWTDANGKVRYGDRKPKAIEPQTFEIKIDKPVTPAKEAEKVVMYSTSWSVHCEDARKYLSSHNIPFVNYDIEQDVEANKRYSELGGKGVPLILYKGEQMTGFSEAQFEQLYQ